MSNPKDVPKPQPGILKLSLAGVTLWERGEELTPQERERRMARALRGLQREPTERRRQGYAGDEPA